jgi:hypothetical protein
VNFQISGCGNGFEAVTSGGTGGKSERVEEQKCFHTAGGLAQTADLLQRILLKRIIKQ